MSADLFSSLSSEHARLRQDADGEGTLTFRARETGRLAETLFSNLRKGGFCTTLVPGRRSWDCRSEAHEAARAAARRGCRIERAFLLPGRYLRHDQALREHQALDRAAGIETRILDVSALVPALDLPPDRALDFGLWDGQIACSAVYEPGSGATGPGAWRVSRREADLDFYGALAHELKAKGAAVALDDHGPPELEEPLASSAHLARLVAPGLCRRDPATGDDCADIHRAWLYFRIFDVVPSPQRNPEFFQDALRQLARDGGHGRVLISGSCDYAMLAHLLHAYRLEGAHSEVTLVDLCPTPQYLCNWYAKWVDHPLESQVSDILDYSADRPFDAICTHSFLYNFRPSQRKHVIAKWHELLRPGGKLVTSARISGTRSETALSWDPDQRRAFRDRIYGDAVKWQGLLAIDPEEIATDAETFAGRPGGSYGIESREELAGLFENGGFALDTLDLVDWAGNVARGQVGPGTNRPATYAHIVVSRR
jgi:SAM-dependent methyltransferase